uniref:Uncharacterized protein DKFZp434I2135 n=1 Tax=Homo sapiens TaxID=9606 RepID=Q8NDL7_HUMAN|nr:hypothetical protein [Homo sapiens]
MMVSCPSGLPCSWWPHHPGLTHWMVGPQSRYPPGCRLSTLLSRAPGLRVEQGVPPLALPQGGARPCSAAVRLLLLAVFPSNTQASLPASWVAEEGQVHRKGLGREWWGHLPGLCVSAQHTCVQCKVHQD